MKQIVVIFGIECDLGRRLAHHLEYQGANVVGIKIPDSSEFDLASGAKAGTGELTQGELVSSYLESAMKTTTNENVHALVFAGSYIPQSLKLEEVTLEEYNECVFMNSGLPLMLFNFLKPRMVANPKVLFVSDVASHVPLVGLGMYSSSRAAYDMIRRIICLENRDMAVASALNGINREQFIKNSEPLVSYDKSVSGRYRNLPEFLCWLILNCEVDVFRDEQWDLVDDNHLALWKTTH